MAVLTPKLGIFSLSHTPIKNEAIKLKRDRDLYKQMKLAKNIDKTLIMHGKFSGSFPDYTIFICKFKTDECFIFMKRF